MSQHNAVKSTVNAPADVATLDWQENHFNDMANFSACEDFLINRCASMEDARKTLELMLWHGMGIVAEVTDYEVRERFACSDSTPKLFSLAS